MHGYKPLLADVLEPQHYIQTSPGSLPETGPGRRSTKTAPCARREKKHEKDKGICLSYENMLRQPKQSNAATSKIKASIQAKCCDFLALSICVALHFNTNTFFAQRGVLHATGLLGLASCGTLESSRQGMLKLKASPAQHRIENEETSKRRTFRMIERFRSFEGN